jgi:hypothetical protein
VKFTKSPLAGLKARGSGSSTSGGGGADRDEISRRANLGFIKNARFPPSEFVSALHLTDAEIEAYLLANNRDIIARGTVDKADYSDMRTVPWLGWQVIKNGWAVVPQVRTGDRKPAEIKTQDKAGKYGRDVKESRFAFRPSLWRDRLMSVRDFLQFEHILNANLALQCCVASQHIRVLDIDCRDPEAAGTIMAMAIEELGATPFVRYGERPKVMLIYRVSAADADEQWQRKFTIALKGADGQDDVDEDGQPMNAVEWLSTGSLITAFGYHHKTGRNFEWPDRSPLNASPGDAPIVDKARLRKFINRVQAYRQVVGAVSTSNPYGNKSNFTEFTPNDTYRSRLWTPKRSTGEWILDGQGRVIDGAEKWLTAQAWAFCAANADKLRFGGVMQDLIDELIYVSKPALLGTARSSALFSSEASLERAVRDKMQTAAAKFNASLESKRTTGQFHQGVVPWSIAEDGRRPTAQRVAPSPRPVDGSLDWIPDESCPVETLAEVIPTAKVSIVDKTADKIAADRQIRALWQEQADRKRIGEQVKTGVRARINEWLGSVAGWDKITPVAPWILKAPTGAGKTVGTVSELAGFCADNPRQPGQGPILLVLPTHANADEAMATALREGMFAPELWSDEQLDQLEQDLHGRGVKIVRFRGRVAAGCQRATELRALQDKGIGASRLCGAEVEDGTELEIKMARKEGKKLEKVELLCRFREAGSCGYYNQISDLDTADIVIVAHAYLSLSALPKQIKEPRAVIIDESVTYSLIGQSRFPISTLNAARREPYVTKTDKRGRDGWSDEDIRMWYVGSREELCGQAVQWLAEGKDVASELHRLPNWPELLLAAITVCERANDRTRRVRPDMSAADVEALADEATGRFLLDEIRFWKTVRSRIELIGLGQARGERDARWQVVEGIEIIETDAGKTHEVTPHLRISWRKSPNWAGRPMLLLDASARPRIVEKLFGMAPIVRTVDAPLHVRTIAMIEKTWSNSSFAAKADSSDEELRIIADNIESARRLITTTAVIHGHGRVLVGTTIAVRAVLTGGAWVPPPTVDFVHFGALRGLDFAKAHVAAISIGRSEQPISVIDGYAAALTYDDDAPEAALDVLGTGVTKEGKPLFRSTGWKRINMRTGQDVDHLVPGMQPKPDLDVKGQRQWEEDGKLKVLPTWAVELEESWREEELRQFLGRLRPVFRGTDDDLPPPVWIAAGKILPDGIVVDELLDMKSLLKAWPMAELVRLGGGVLADNVSPHIPGGQEILRGRTLTELAKELPRAMQFLRRWAAPFQHVRYHLASDPDGKDRSAMLLPAWIDGNAQNHWMALSERHGELPDVVSVSPPKIAAPEARPKALDRRDVDRDCSLLAEIEARQAHYAEPLAAEHGRVEFELRRTWGRYAIEDEEASPV